jgi:hypothetical protein
MQSRKTMLKMVSGGDEVHKGPVIIYGRGGGRRENGGVIEK